MDKLPLFNEFKNKFISAIAQIKKAIHNREWKLLILYFITIIAILWSLYLGIRAAYNTAYSKLTTDIQANNSNIAIGNSGSINQTINQYPKTTFSYSFDQNHAASTKQNDGSFASYIYILLLHAPGTEVSLKDIRVSGIFSSCRNFQEPYITQFVGEIDGLLHTSTTLVCTSKIPITDNGNLFRYDP